MKTIVTSFCSVGLLLVLSGCGANSAGSYDPLTPMKTGTDLGQYVALHLEAQSANGVQMTAHDRDRLLNKILRKVQGRYKEANKADLGPHTLFATVQATNYDEGSSLLRFLLAGLGQIHIDGEVTMSDGTQSELGKYAVHRTFACGGWYGLQTKIEDVEDGFAEAVANILLEKDKLQKQM